MSISPIFLITFLSIFIWAHHFCNAAHIFTLQMHHRFSQPVRKWSESFPNFPAADNNWPPKDSIDYYSQLANHDRAFHGRRLSGSGDPLTFADGNSTFRISSLGLYGSLSPTFFILFFSLISWSRVCLAKSPALLLFFFPTSWTFDREFLEFDYPCKMLHFNSWKFLVI